MKTRILVLLVAAASVVLMSQPASREQVGPLPDGGFLLSSGWRIKAAGTQIPVETFPMSQVVTPDKKYLLVLNGGYNPPAVSVIDIAAAKEVGRTGVPDGWLGLTMNKAGDRVYVGGGSKAAVYEFTFANGTLKPSHVFPVVAEKDRRDEDFIGDVQLDPQGHLIYAASLYRDSVVVLNAQSGFVLSRIKTVHRPYRILFHPDGKSIYVSGWTDGSIGRYDVAKGDRLSISRVAPHTTDMVWVPGEVEEQPDVKARIFVSAGNTNNVYTLGVNDQGDLNQIESINLSLTPRQPLGMTPSGLGVSADSKSLFVACSDANAAAIVDISGAHSRVNGFIPTGWYPTAAFGLPDGRIGVLNGKGLQSYANVDGPNPMKRPEPVHEGEKEIEFVGRIQRGAVQFVEMPDEAKLDSYTAEVMGNSPYRDEKLDDSGAPAGNPVRANGPIKHVIYIVKENRTYDQVLGDMKEGNGDANLVLFGEKVTPNLHKIAREFTLLDNFYVNSDVSADGHNWATAAIAPDYTQRLWPNKYANRRKEYDFEGQEQANLPPAGYIWTAAKQAGISIRNYGYWVDNRKTPEADGTQITDVRDPILAPVTDPNYRGFDLNYSDVERAKEFIGEMDDFEKDGRMPQFLIMRMGNDHTNGAAAGKLSPLSFAADNDQGVGMVVERVSKSRFWNETAIFVIEDDAQNGPDHVDSHRSPCWVISPWVNRGTVNSTMYNQASVLRTMELILGLRPLTTYDAGARPMFSVFRNSLSAQPYTLEKPQTPLDMKNPVNTAAARRSAHMDFDDADEIDDDDLNAVLWAAIKGSNVPLPAPVRSRFAH
ncbi:MAG: bifunctional YncE family protein/alkaline phosphatase family protein [Acidobacteriota bacterium]|nr:bifunctional YncE family protein/alkaline phosphatase family protein [Acidobacteriota bacterium]